MGIPRVGWVRRGPTQRAPGPDTESKRVPGPDPERAPPTQRASEERRVPTQRAPGAPGPDKESERAVAAFLRLLLSYKVTPSGQQKRDCVRSPSWVPGGVRLGCLFLVPTSLRFGPSAHVLGMCKGCRHVVSYSGQNCASKVSKQKLHKKSPLSLPIHAQVSAGLITIQCS